MRNTVLIVDDVLLNIDLLTNILGDGYTIMAAVSGKNALKILGHKTPDLVLLDVSMPEMDGFSVLQSMKGNKELANIPVIFVTGDHDAYAEEKGLSLGAVDYIKKPYNAAVIKTKVKNHIDLKAYRDKLELLVCERTKKLAASREAVIMSMSLMSESHDGVTGEHIIRIKKFTKILVDKMLELYPDVITEDMAYQTVLFSPLHDVGKVCIPDSILKKEGTLSKEEFEIMKTHTSLAAELLRKTKLFFPDDEDVNLDVAIEIAESHHEKYDGTGYPNGLKGGEIPISARIVAVADVYDALRSIRPYKNAFTHDEAVKIISFGDVKTDPKQFDPSVLDAFYISHKQFEMAYADAAFT